jgi:Flp pilus assembly protein TadB
MTKIVAAFALLLASLVLVPTRPLLLFSLFWVNGLFAVILFPAFLRWRRKSEIKKSFPLILNSLILKIRLGLALRPALLSVADQMEGYAGKKIKLLHEHLVVKATMSQVDPVFFELQLLLRECDRDPHRISERLLNYREKVRTEREFIEKRSLAIRQVWVQALALCFLYLTALVYVLNHYGYAEHVRSTILSALLFVVGAYFTFTAGRKCKWQT